VAKNTVKLLDVVALTVDIPEYNLRRGQVGTVVEMLADGAAFEVEFSDRATDALMNLSDCQERKSWCCTSSQHHLISSLR
jgi:hypothetical protein